MACRDTSKAQSAADAILKELGETKDVGQLVIKSLDLGSLSSVRKCAEDINQNETAVHLLINNAGVMMVPKSETEDGFETHFGVNHLGHFLFTCLLLPKMIQSSPSRVINVSSKAHEWGKFDFSDLNWKHKKYDANKLYGQSKLANVLFTVELARRLQDKGVISYSLHPGVVRTELGRHMDDTYFKGARLIAKLIFAPIMISPSEGAKTTLYCCYKNVENDNGAYFSDCTLKKRFDSEEELKEAKQLWDESCRLVNINPDL